MMAIEYYAPMKKKVNTDTRCLTVSREPKLFWNRLMGLVWSLANDTVDLRGARRTAKNIHTDYECLRMNQDIEFILEKKSHRIKKALGYTEKELKGVKGVMK